MAAIWGHQPTYRGPHSSPGRHAKPYDALVDYLAAEPRPGFDKPWRYYDEGRHLDGAHGANLRLGHAVLAGKLPWPQAHPFSFMGL